jgi:hypothetical protein
MEGVEGISTIHWFPGDLVERWMEVDGKYGPVREPVFGLVAHILGVPDKTTLYVLVPGSVKAHPFPADECRLVRRVNWNKEGQS